MNIDTRYEVLELARFLCELSVFDYFFVVQRPSNVGLAALLNATDIVPGVSSEAVEGLKSELLRNIPGLDPESSHVKECCDRLEMLYAQGGYSRPVPAEEAAAQEEEEPPRVKTISPVCVSGIYGDNPNGDTTAAYNKKTFEYNFTDGQS